MTLKQRILLVISTMFISIVLYGAPNPFLKGVDEKNQTPKKELRQENQSKPLKKSWFYRNIVKFQQDLNKNISEKIQKLNTDGSFKIFFLICLIAFLYGIIHAFGPGHGKGVITGWILAGKKKFYQITLASVMAAFMHAFSAVVIIMGAWFLLKETTTLSSEKLSGYIAVFTGFFLMGLAIFSLIRFIVLKLKKKNHEHDHNSKDRFKSKMNPYLIALSIGIVPCPISSVILIFSLGMGLYWQGVIFVLFFAMGMAITLFSLSLLVWLFHERMTMSKKSYLQWAVHNLFPILTVLFFFFAGFFILIPYLYR